MSTTTFLDTSPLLSGVIDFGPQSAPAQEIMHAVAEKRLAAATAWHCCLELFSVATRLPPEFRLSPKDAALMIEEEVLGRMQVRELPADGRDVFLRSLPDEGITGGRIYDAHIAEIARAAGAAVIVTDNRRHFLAALRFGIRVETTAEFARSLKSHR